MGVKVKFVGTTWPTLTADVLADPQMFDFAIGGITITDARCAAPLLDTPFTRGEIGILMRKGQEDLLLFVNDVLKQMKADSSLQRLHQKYGLVYIY